MELLLVLDLDSGLAIGAELAGVLVELIEDGRQYGRGRMRRPELAILEEEEPTFT